MPIPVRTANDKLNKRKAKLEMSTDGGTTWDDISSYGVAITPDAPEAESEEFRTLDGTVEESQDETLPIHSVTARFVITDAVTGPYDVVFAALYSTDQRVDFRWGQGGSATGDRRFTTVGGNVKSCPAVSFDSTTSAVAIEEAKISCSSITKDTYP